MNGARKVYNASFNACFAFFIAHVLQSSILSTLQASISQRNSAAGVVEKGEQYAETMNNLLIKFKPIYCYTKILLLLLLQLDLP